MNETSPEVDRVALKAQLVSLMVDRIIFTAETKTSYREELEKLVDESLNGVSLTPARIQKRIALEQSEGIPRCKHCGKLLASRKRPRYHLQTHSQSCDTGGTEAEL